MSLERGFGTRRKHKLEFQLPQQTRGLSRDIDQRNLERALSQTLEDEDDASDSGRIEEVHAAQIEADVTFTVGQSLEHRSHGRHGSRVHILIDLYQSHGHHPLLL